MTFIKHAAYYSYTYFINMTFIKHAAYYNYIYQEQWIISSVQT